MPPLRNAKSAPGPLRCMHREPNSSAWRTPVQFFGGCGSRQRRFPTGGCAKGIPLKTRTPAVAGVVVSRIPLAVLTRSPAVAPDEAAARQIAIMEWRAERGARMTSTLFDNQPPPPSREPLEEGAVLLRGFALTAAATLIDDV